MELDAEDFFDLADDAAVFGDAAGHHVAFFAADASAEGAGLCGDGAIEAVDDVGGGAVFSDEADDFAFGENGAHAGDGDVFFPFQAESAHVVEGKLKGARHELKKTTGAGGAFVVHDEVDDVAVFVQTDDLAVLAADIDDGAHAWIEKISAFGVAGDLSDGLVAEFDSCASVASGDGGVDVAA